ncbi:MAG: DUF3180 domain-containing protein [Dermatophilaceae bacterium]
MKAGIGPQALAAVVVVTGAASFVLFTLLTRDGSLVPAPPVVAGVLLVVIAAPVTYLARQVRRHTRGGKWIEPLRAARTVVLAQAAALTGAAAIGWYAGQVLVVAGDLTLLANRDRLLSLLPHLVAAVLLVSAGMLAQQWCRIDRDDAGRTSDRGQRDDTGGDSSGHGTRRG